MQRLAVFHEDWPYARLQLLTRDRARGIRVHSGQARVEAPGMLFGSGELLIAEAAVSALILASLGFDGALASRLSGASKLYWASQSC